MREPEMLDFPLEEYKARLDGLTRRMKQQGMDPVFLTAAENLRYFTGLQSVVWSSPVSTPGVLLITADGFWQMVGYFFPSAIIVTLFAARLLHRGRHTVFR